MSVTAIRRHYVTIRCALRIAVEWEMGSADAYSHCKEEPEYKASLRRAAKYRRVLKALTPLP